jgi:hypothetical protein
MCHGGDDDTQIGVDGDVVGEVPGDDDKDGPAKETARMRTVCCDARRAPRVRRLQPCRAVDEDGRCRSMPLSE